MSEEIKLFEKAKNLHFSGKIKEAQKLYLKLIKSHKDNHILNYLLGTTLLQIENYYEAIKYFDKSIKLNPNLFDAYNNKGIALNKIEKYNESIQNYNQAIKLKKDFFDAYLNKGISFKNLKEYNKAIDCFEYCIKLKPDDPKIYNNLGNLNNEIKNYEKAIKYYDKAIKLNNNFAEAYYSRAVILHSFNHISLAVNDYEKAIKLNGNFDYVHGDLMHAKMHMCDWDNFYELKKKIENEIKNKKKVIRPFALLSLNDEQDLHKVATTLYAKSFFPTISDNNKNSNNNNKIKLGYFSPDFREHAVTHLILDVFKNHDKSLFEIYGFNHGPRNDQWTNEVKKNFDKFFNVYNKSEEEIAILSRKNKIDIAIDLCGYTKYSISNAYYHRAAPIQINYLGYPGTMGSKNYDYIIADKNVLPQSEFKNFSEKVLYLPNCYQANQAKIKISESNFSKKDFNLPNDKFIFGCLNSNYKINPIIYDSWMEILRSCKDSVLWLLKENNDSSLNLVKEASKRGVGSERIIFTEKAKMDIHLKRVQFIDLFLDTYPYGAHTTASEAIRMGVPVITIKGNSFASRVATSILKTVGMNNLITKNIGEYTRVAINLGVNKDKLSKLKNHLSNNKNINKLFDSKKYTKDLEKIYLNLSKNKL